MRLQVHDSSITHYVQRGLLHVVERRPPQGQQFFRWAEVEALAGPMPSPDVLDELWLLLLRHSRSLTRILKEVLLAIPRSPV